MVLYVVYFRADFVEICKIILFTINILRKILYVLNEGFSLEEMMAGTKPENTTKKAMPKKYDASDIVVLEGLEAVRLRPGMYIGTTGVNGLHHLLWEIVDNSVDEALNGYADTIHVVLNNDGSVSVEDNGRGMPIDKHPKYKKSGVELIFTQLHAGGKFDNKEYEFSGGLHGVGAAVVNALSDWLEVEVCREKKVYSQRYEKIVSPRKIQSGIPKGDLECIGTTKKRGTKVTFKPDATVFETVEFNHDTIAKRLRELAYLTKGVTFTFTDMQRVDENGEPFFEKFYFKGGLVDFVKSINEHNTKRSEKVIYVEAVDADKKFQVQVAIQYTDKPEDDIVSYVNNIPTHEGGTHETGFKLAFTKAMNEFVKKNNLLKAKDTPPSGDDYRDGMSAVISVRMQDMQFEGQTKTKLGNPEVKGWVDSLVYEQLNIFFAEKKNKELGTMIFKLAVSSSKMRNEEKKFKEALRAKNSMAGKVLVGKLASCSGKDYSRNELFIVEGDSAGGSTKQGRDPKFQAVLPLRGKPLNTLKSSGTSILANEEIQTIIYALGTDFDRNFDIKNLKYDKIIILADADHDGEHIRCLLLTFFYQHMRPLVEQGHVYLGMPPLYKVEQKKTGFKKYAYNDNELENILSEVKGSYHLQRYKGLGEMNYDQLRDTTLKPGSRTLTRVTIDDVEAATKTVSLWMGDDAKARQTYINANANFNKVDTFKTKFGG